MTKPTSRTSRRICRAGRPARKRRSGADHQADQRDPHPGGEDNASDIHVEPFENAWSCASASTAYCAKCSSPGARSLRCGLAYQGHVEAGYAEKRLPQDGRISLRVAGRAVDVRVSTIPGSRRGVVLRLLDKQAGRLELGALGMDPRTQKQMDELIHKPHGIPGHRPTAPARPRRCTRHSSASTTTRATF
jgi:hypothetical protein